MKDTGRTRIGISNGTMPGNKKTFPEAFQSKSRLHYYSSMFDTIEVNSCFYKIPRLVTVEKWSKEVPAGFQFSLKLYKELTHTKNLEGDLNYIQSFMQAANGTDDKKGCILLQFPGKITLDHFNQVETILETVQQQDPVNEWRKAIEFRDESWYTAETRELMDEFDAAIVLHDFAKAKNAHFTSKADFVYIRFHGPKGNYRDSYADQFLQMKASEIRLMMEEGKDVYCYFNNTIGKAFENALKLKSLLQLPVPL